LVFSTRRFLPGSVFCVNHPAPTDIYTLSLHDALPIYDRPRPRSAPRARRRPGAARGGLRDDESAAVGHTGRPRGAADGRAAVEQDRKSTRLNSSHVKISYAVFCLKKKKKNKRSPQAEN